ncbi:MAG: hypothetical protein U0525_03565 [Patescibacteria group bacterium]
MINSELGRSIRLAKITAEQLYDSEQESKKNKAQYWGIYQRDFESYHKYFKLKGVDITPFVNSLSERGDVPLVLDLLADTSCIRSVENAQGVSVGLCDDRTYEARLGDRDHRRYMVEGSVFDVRTLRDVDKLRKIKWPDRGFDLVLERGHGGTNSYLPTSGLLKGLMNKIYRMTNPSGSLMCLCLPDDSRILWDAAIYASHLNKHEALCCGVYRNVFALQRFDGSPALLPAPTDYSE